MKIAIIGAGPGGLAALRHSLQENFEAIAFEQTEYIGGVWHYTDLTELDENGIPVHSSMYEGLRTNIAKELMEFEDFPFTDVEESKTDPFASREEVMNYIQKYADHFNLMQYVMLCHQVILTDPLTNGKWIVKIRNVKSKAIIEDVFDAVIVCNGHYFDPFLPDIQGKDTFAGNSIHCHKFRKAEKYRNKKVLLIGAGPSGTDIAQLLSPVALKVFLSYDEATLNSPSVPKKVTLKPKVKYIENSAVIFADNSREEIDEIIYCTGYKYSFPFFTEKCGISFTDNWVQPLYKQLINIEHPTMCIINIPNFNLPFPLFGIQVRFFLDLLKGQFRITKSEMYEDLRKEKDLFDKMEKPLNKIHFLGPRLHENYLKDLAITAHIKPVPSVISKIFIHQIEYTNGLCRYKILNDEEFVATPIHGTCCGSRCG